MKSTIFYKNAIEIVSKNEYDTKLVCLKLAQERPDLFCKFVSDPIVNITEKLLALGRSGKKIEAIKEHRAFYNTSLLDAKNAVEQMFKDANIN